MPFGTKVPPLQAYAATWNLRPPAGSTAPFAGGTVPVWQMGMCVSCQGTSDRIQIGLHFWRAGHSLLCSPSQLQDQLMKPSLYVRPWFPCACISRTPILGATNGEREKMDGACSPLPGFVYTYVYSEDGHLCTEKHEIPRSACWGVALASLTVDCTVSA